MKKYRVSAKKHTRAGKAVSLLAAVCLLPAPLVFSAESSPNAGPGVYNASIQTVDKPAASGAPDAAAVEQIQKSTWLSEMNMEKGRLRLTTGHSHLMRLERKVARISISNPEVLDAIILSPDEILLNARAEGAANVILWDHLDDVTVLDVTVIPDPGILYSLLNKISPDSNFDIYPSREAFVVKGEVDTVDKQQQIARAATAFAEGSVSLVNVRAPKQVLLKIRFVQLDRSSGLNLGLDLEYDRSNDSSIVTQRLLPGGTNAETSGDSTNSFTNAAGSLTFDIFDRNDTDVYQIARFTDDGVLQGFLKAIESEGIGKIIARPNLLASDGEEASFLVGGEAAVVAISSDSVGVDYREFGTRLTFTPRILEDGRMRLTVAPEVSSLDFANGVVVNDVVIPSFTTVRTSTVVELRDRETFMIGGLLQQKITMNDSGIPFLRRIPLIGKLFENTDQSVQETELLVIVTPTFIDPLGPELDQSERELLEQATKLDELENRSPRRDAVTEIIEGGGRPLSEQIRRLSEREVVAVEIDGTKEVKSLEELEGMLQERWPGGKEVSTTGAESDTVEESEDDKNGQRNKNLQSSDPTLSSPEPSGSPSRADRAPETDAENKNVSEKPAKLKDSPPSQKEAAGEAPVGQKVPVQEEETSGVAAGKQPGQAEKTAPENGEPVENLIKEKVSGEKDLERIQDLLSMAEKL